MYFKKIKKENSQIHNLNSQLKNLEKQQNKTDRQTKNPSKQAGVKNSEKKSVKHNTDSLKDQ